MDENGPKQTDSTNDGLVQLVAFFVRYRRPLIMSLAVGIVLAVLIRFVLPPNLVGAVYSTSEVHQFTLRYHVLSDPSRRVIRDRPANTIRQWILEDDLLRSERVSIHEGPSGNVPHTGGIEVIVLEAGDDDAAEVGRLLAEVANDVRSRLEADAVRYITSVYERLNIDPATSLPEGTSEEVINALVQLAPYVDGSLSPISLGPTRITEQTSDNRNAVSFTVFALVVLLGFVGTYVRELVRKVAADPSGLSTIRDAWTAPRKPRGERRRPL